MKIFPNRSFRDEQAGVSHHFATIMCLREGSPIGCQDEEETHKLAEVEAVPTIVQYMSEADIFGDDGT